MTTAIVTPEKHRVLPEDALSYTSEHPGIDRVLSLFTRLDYQDTTTITGHTITLQRIGCVIPGESRTIQSIVPEIPTPGMVSSIRKCYQQSGITIPDNIEYMFDTIDRCVEEYVIMVKGDRWHHHTTVHCRVNAWIVSTSLAGDYADVQVISQLRMSE